jgi:hypothetical protein
MFIVASVRLADQQKTPILLGNQAFMELVMGLEPATARLQGECSTN